MTAMRHIYGMWAALALALATGLPAQSLATRVDRASDGVVRVTVDSRAGVCGDGRDVVGYRSAIFARNFQSIGGRWNADRCVPGPLKVTLSKVDGAVSRIRTQVGGEWPQTEQRVTDLGAVPATEASAYFFSLVPRLETGGKDRLLIPAVLADGPPPVQPLLALARNTDRAIETRRDAIQWLGLVGDETVVPVLARMAHEDVRDDDSGKGGKKGIGNAALAALSMVDGDAGVPALIDLARSGSPGIRHDAVFWLGQNGDLRARRMLHTVIEDANESSRIRAHAIFSLTHGHDTPESEFNWLRGVYARLEGETLKEAALQGMTQDEEPAGGRWLIDRALDAAESLKLRKSALFWAGQHEETPTAELVRVYRQSRDTELREHAIFVLSQRHGEAAVDALIRIAREDPDTRMRGKALFWLAQKDDSRVKQLIADIVLKERP